MTFPSLQRLWHTVPVALWAVALVPLGCEPQVLDPLPVENTRDNADLSCDTHGDCALPALFCDTTTRSCVECRNEDDCDRGTCDPLTHTCRRSCSTNNDCDEGSRRRLCASDRGVCVECANDAHCEVGLRRCESDTCIECESDQDCQDGDERYCEVERSRCRECLEDDHCPSGTHCDENDMRCESNAR